MWIFLIAVSVIADLIETKEDVCYLLANRHFRDRSEEIQEYISKNGILTRPSLKSKLVEDSFDMCVNAITLEELGELRQNFLKKYSEFFHLTRVPLNKYKNFQDVKVSKEFADRSIEIAKRAAMNPRQFSKDL